MDCSAVAVLRRECAFGRSWSDSAFTLGPAPSDAFGEPQHADHPMTALCRPRAKGHPPCDGRPPLRQSANEPLSGDPGVPVPRVAGCHDVVMRKNVIMGVQGSGKGTQST